VIFCASEEKKKGLGRVNYKRRSVNLSGDSDFVFWEKGTVYRGKSKSDNRGCKKGGRKKKVIGGEKTFPRQGKGGQPV